MKFLAVILGMLMLVGMGCAQKAVRMSPAEQQQLQSIQQGKYDSQGDKKLTDGEVSEEELARRDQDRMRALSLKDQKSAAQFKDVLFDFDSYAIKDEYFRQLSETGDWLKQNKNVKIIIEGHCDEKGTVEYNLALGQKRAEAVNNYLTKSGVDALRIKTISYGKELPADPEHTEDAWAKNRRAGIKFD